ncbi:MAG TPA: CBS domain-containing protein [Rhizomicrobium sp.]
MKIEDVMTHDVAVVSPDETIQQAAELMDQLDIGALPVAENERLVGMITDRDIVVRAVADGLDPSIQVSDVMTPDVKYCFCDQEVAEISDNMADIQIRRLPVVDRSKRLVGIIALGDIATCAENDYVADALAGISRPHADGENLMRLG